MRGNDPYLYGDKVKAYLRKGAKKLPGEQSYPNPGGVWGVVREGEPAGLNFHTIWQTENS